MPRVVYGPDVASIESRDPQDFDTEVAGTPAAAVVSRTSAAPQP
jgi:hypothetical protein